MKYDVKCHNLGCDAHYTHDDCGSETSPSRCAYCGSTKVKVTEISEDETQNVDSTDFPGEISTSTILLVEELVNKKDFDEIMVALAAVEALLPSEEKPKLDMSDLFHGDIKLVAEFLKELQNATDKFALNYRSWGQALHHYIFDEDHDIVAVLQTLSNKDTLPETYGGMFEEVRDYVYDCIEN